MKGSAQLTQFQWDSNVLCSCGNQQLDRTKDRIAALCFHFLVYRCLYEGYMVLQKCFPKTQNRFHHAYSQVKIPA